MLVYLNIICCILSVIIFFFRELKLLEFKNLSVFKPMSPNVAAKTEPGKELSNVFSSWII